jgi:hypothetical protein
MSFIPVAFLACAFAISANPFLFASEEPTDKRPAAVAASPAKEVMEALLKTFRQREKDVATAAFSWSRRLVQSRGQDDSQPDSIQQTTADDFALKTTTETLTIKRNKMRYETTIPSFIPAANGSSKLITAFNGDTTFSHQPDNNSGRGQGVIGKAEISDDLQNVHLLAIVLAVFPCHPQLLGIDAENWEVADEPVVIEGNRCIEVRPKAEGRAQPMYRKIWVDPERDFAIRRFELIREDGKAAVAVAIGYAQGMERPWIPSQWKVDTLFGGSSSEGSENTMSTAAINQPIADDLFEIKYPTGTIVFDKRKNKEEEFVVGEDGRLIPHEAEIPGTAQMPAPPLPASTQRNSLLLFNLCAAVAIVGYLIYRGVMRSR